MTLHTTTTVTFLAVCLLLTCCLDRCYSYTDPVLQTIAENPDASGNNADSNSTITWAEYPQGDKYEGGKAYDDAGMGALFDMTRTFINTAFPKGFPTDLVEKFKNGNLDMIEDAKKFVLDYVGYAACIAIGLLFIIIFPIVALCFCCCRCCGNCGGKKLQKYDPSASCKRKVYGLLFLLITVITGVGVACSFVVNERMTGALDKLSTSSLDELSDIKTYLNNTMQQINQLVPNFNFTKNVIFRDLDSIGFLVGIPIRDKLGTDGNIIASLDSALTLQSTVDVLIPQMNDLDSSMTNLKDNVTQLNDELSSAKTDIDNAKSCGSDCPFDTSFLVSNIDVNNLPNISSQKSSLDSLSSNNLTSLVASARQNFDTIPEKVENETVSLISDLKTQVNDFSSTIEKLPNMINGIVTNSSDKLNIEDMKSKIKDYLTIANSYNQYRWYGGVGLAGLVLLIVLLNLIGLMFGVCGSSADDVPTERGCLSNSGGTMLMAAVGFIFIFSPLLMLLTTVTFTIGSPLERFLCQPIKDPEMTVINQLVDQFVSTTDGSFLGNMLFQDPSINLTLQGILKDCKEGKSIYKALKLENLPQFNINDLVDYSSKINITGMLDQIDGAVNFSAFNILTPELSAQLDDTKNATDGINFTAFGNELSQNTTTDLSLFITVLQNYTDNLSAGDEKTTMQAVITNLTHTNNETLPNTKTAQSEVLAAATALNKTISGVPAQVDDINAQLTAAQDYLRNNASSVLKSQAKSYVDRIFSIVDSFINDTLEALNNDIGKCTPIYNIYNDLLVNGVCGYVIDTLNAFWFTLGWCVFFFMPSLIFGVKLAKHYRRMNYTDNFESGKPPVSTKLPLPPGQGPFIGSNKVGHSDKW